MQRHIAATEVAPGKLAGVLEKDYRRLGVGNNNGGSVTDSAKDVIVTMPGAVAVWGASYVVCWVHFYPLI